MSAFLKKIISGAERRALFYVLKKPFNEGVALERIAEKHAKDDLLERFQLLTRIAEDLLPEYRFKWPQVDWWNDKAFNDYIRRFEEDKAHNTDRRWMVRQLIRLTEEVEGDTAECGVYSGSTSWLISRYSQSSKWQRTHFGFDSFSGLSEPGDRDGDYWQKGSLSYPREKVERNLADLERVILKEGWIPERFNDDDIVNRRFSFVHIDVDLYQPTLDSVRFFYPRLQPGGILLCDDYGSSFCPGATRAIDEHLQACPEKMLSLSGGGGFFIKGTAVTN
jgi:hypothetical protein